MSTISQVSNLVTQASALLQTAAAQPVKAKDSDGDNDNSVAKSQARQTQKTGSVNLVA